MTQYLKCKKSFSFDFLATSYEMFLKINAELRILPEAEKNEGRHYDSCLDPSSSSYESAQVTFLSLFSSVAAEN
jgi:hypothetical protein